MRYKVTGNHAVAGVPPGRTVELDLPAENIDALVQAGHVAEQRSAKKKAPEPKDEG